MSLDEYRNFQRGYILCEAGRAKSAHSHFYETPLPDGLVFRHDASLSVAFQKGKNCWLLIAGFGVDTLRPIHGAKALSKELFNALTTSEAAMFDRLDDISGRFVLVYYVDGKTKILTDATGLKTCFYSPRHKLISSHLNLMEIVTGEAPSPFASMTKFPRGFPGRMTRLNGVFALTPNTLIEWPSFHIRRFWPRHPIGQLSVEDAAEIIIPKLKTQVKALSLCGKVLLISLTAGFDSRATLAITHKSIRSGYFTYRRAEDKYHAADIEIATRIAKTLKLDHATIDIPPFNHDDCAQFYDMLKDSSAFSNNPALALSYWRCFRSFDAIHIASNLSEIGRAFYRNRVKRPGTMTAKDMARVIPYLSQRDKEIIDAFDEFCISTERDKLLNYDQSDLFYWEHRMARWMAPSLSESDPSFDTHVLFNCRRILAAALAVPHEDRVKSTVNRIVVSRFVPQIADISFNPAG